MMLIFNIILSCRIYYCHLVWGSATQANLQKILLQQKRFLRIVGNVPATVHTQELFIEYDVTPVAKLHKYRMCGTLKQNFNIEYVFFWQPWPISN